MDVYIAFFYVSVAARLQVLADISRSALYAFAVYKAISLHRCVLSQQRANPCTDCKCAQ